jgi:hypothetical protein
MRSFVHLPQVPFMSGLVGGGGSLDPPDLQRFENRRVGRAHALISGSSGSALAGGVQTIFERWILSGSVAGPSA